MPDKVLYQWIPKRGVSLEAVERIRAHFSIPKEPMGEAWFIGKERRLFTELLETNPLEKIKPNDLSFILDEISSGTNCFGHRDEWDEWFKYLLADLILHTGDIKFFKTMIVQDVVTAFMSIYWKDIFEEYEGFRIDVINSLSLCLMNADLWFDCKDEKTQTTFPRPIFLYQFEDGRRRLKLDWNAGQADENLSAMMFFCLKYLKPEEITTWVKSLFSIEDTYWKGALAVWILGAYDLLQKSIVVPSMLEKSEPKISWMSSHSLDSSYGSIDAKYPPHEDFNDNKDFLPFENTQKFSEEIRRQLSAELLVEWAELFSQDSLVLESTYNVPELLLDKISG